MKASLSSVIVVKNKDKNVSWGCGIRHISNVRLEKIEWLATLPMKISILDFKEAEWTPELFWTKSCEENLGLPTDWN